MTVALRGLYAILDVDAVRARGGAPLVVAAGLLAARPPILQLRAKRAAPRATLELLRALRAPCTEAGCWLFANDRPDLAELAGADGVHVGQGDLPIPEVRRHFPGLRVGLSTHDEAQLGAGLALRPDYVALGPVFPTASKVAAEPVVGLSRLVAAAEAARAAAVPLVAIGGIDEQRLAEVAAHAPLVAMIGALFAEGVDAQAVERTARRLSRAVALAGATAG